MKEAAVLQIGTAASFCSTRIKGLSLETPFPIVSQHTGKSRGALYELLPETHYFRRHLAKRPPALVIRTEGMKSPLVECREVAP